MTISTRRATPLSQKRNFFNSLMATWKTLMHPHLKCMHQQVAVSPKHVTLCNPQIPRRNAATSMSVSYKDAVSPLLSVDHSSAAADTTDLTWRKDKHREVASFHRNNEASLVNLL